MKTLDKVIEELTIWDTCDEYPESFYDFEVTRDALHYLKDYRENQYAYEEGNRKAEEARERYLEAVKNCELAENKYKRLYEETSQKLSNTSQEITCPKCHSEFVILPENNDPLTWEELKGMEGKPVWVEIENNDPVWAIPMGITTLGNNERMCMVGAEGGHAIHVEVSKDSINGWQAYRKERTE